MSQQPRKSVPNNVQCTLLTRQENDQVFNLLGKRCITLATSVVQVFLAKNGNSWVKHCCGVACFVKDNPNRSYYIRVYDIIKHAMVWEQELYNQFRYKKPRPFFHTFCTDSCWAGLNFANDIEAENFGGVIIEKISMKQQRREKRRTAPPVPPANSTNNTAPPLPVHRSQSARAPARPAPKLSSPSLREVHHTPNQISNDNKERKKDKKNKGKKGKITKADIGLPSNFQHVSHVGWDPDKGFDTNNMDPTVKGWFESIGVTEALLKDKNTAKFINDFIEEHGGIDAVKKEAERIKPDAPPPPPPSDRFSQPPRRESALPPPPPSRRDLPPPPPSRDSRASPRPQRAPAPRPPSQSSRGLPPLPPNPSQPPPISRPGQSRGPPPPPVGGGGGGPPPPPPPPPPSAVAAPPPPPPPVPSGGGPSMGGGGGGGRSDLLSQIQHGRDLKPVEQNNTPKDTPRGALLDQIRGGKKLKRVSMNEERPNIAKNESINHLGSLLSKALDDRKKAMQSDDSDCEEDDDFEDDDDEWED
ncbi:neural Wiskott-Aldrich syndrome protein-like isoform X2 [Anneissia japonica]|uniref:neural Wiskott-Aldrich syndrome protein-like isoform X2 n=1 Tax=Anneissia japonica TaxID=1529436 RepID=UPI001425659B|nr:neural Wiskott-Aldrich syndrome protein-like isoform X2 [Anneissia japonica]XP_033110965.1 neural Wiskott-Aldrich syndrome protein-like isoform X2 [Anneissia japonica]